MPKVIVQITKNFKDINVNLSKLEELTKAVCTRFAQPYIRGAQYEISIVIVDDAEMRKANKQFLNRSVTTDCLSFDLSDDTKKKSFELIVNAEKAAKEAALRGHLAEAELALYVTHGLLHNLGFNDSTKSRAKKMHETEDEILQQQGYGFVYNS